MWFYKNKIFKFFFRSVALNKSAPFPNRSWWRSLGPDFWGITNIVHNFSIVYQHRAQFLSCYQHRAFFVLFTNIVQCFSCTPKKEGAFHRFFDLSLLALNFILPTFFFFFRCQNWCFWIWTLLRRLWWVSRRNSCE